MFYTLSATIWRKLHVCFWWYLLAFTHDSIVWRKSWPVAELISNAFLHGNTSETFLFHMISEAGACIGCGWCSTSMKLEFHGLSSVVWADAYTTWNTLHSYYILGFLIGRTVDRWHVTRAGDRRQVYHDSSISILLERSMPNHGDLHYHGPVLITKY